MAIDRARTALGQIFLQRCFYLFIGVLGLVTAVLILQPSPLSRVLVNAINLLIAVAAVAAVGRSSWSFVVATTLAVPTMVFQWRAFVEDNASHLLVSWSFGAALNAVTIGYLLRYVFQREVMTADKLYGAAAGYLMLGALWAYLYAVADVLQPGSFVSGGVALTPSFADLLYFSFTTLTSTGYGDFAPLLRVARGLCVLEQLTGALFLAILIARLAGVYPVSPPPEQSESAPQEPRFLLRMRERMRSKPPG